MVDVPTTLPPAGTPGVFDPRNPTLIPNFDRAVSVGDTLNHQSPAQALAANPRTNATAVATIGGSVTTGDILTIEVQNPTFPGGLISHTYTTLGGDTADTVADSLADLFNDDAIAAQHGLRAEALGAVITFDQSGPVGNFSVLVVPNEESASITVGGTSRTGDTIEVLFAGPLFGAGVLVSFATTTGQTAAQNATALAAAITANAALVALGISAAAVSTAVNLTVPATAEPVTVTAWVNTITTTATISATTAAAGDTLNLTFTNAAIPGGARTVSFVALGGENANALAAALGIVVNADAVLTAAGIAASVGTNVVTFHYQQINGAIRYAQSVSVGAETIALAPAAPTETAVVGTNATETITLTPTTGVLSGGGGPVFAANNFEFAPPNGGVQAYFYGQPYDLGYDLLSAMVTQGMPIV